MKKSKILLSCSFDWLTSQVCNDVISGHYRPIYFTSLNKKYLRSRGLNKKVEILNYFGVIKFIRALIVRLTNNPYYFYPLFDIINLLNLIILRPNIFIGWSSMSYISLLYCNLFNIKTYLFCGSSHINDFNQLKETSSKFLRFIYSTWVNNEYRITDKIIIESNFIKKSFLKNGINENKLIIIPTKPENKIFYNRENYIINSKPFKCITIGTHKIKSIDLVIDLWIRSKLYKKNDAELLILGKLNKTIRNLIEQNDIKNIINYVNLPQIEVIKHIEQSHLYICLTKNDAGPRSLIESYMLGCEILCSNNCIGTDLISDNVYVYELSDIDSISQKLSNIYESKKTKKTKKTIPYYELKSYEEIF